MTLRRPASYRFRFSRLDREDAVLMDIRELLYIIGRGVSADPGNGGAARMLDEFRDSRMVQGRRK